MIYSSDPNRIEPIEEPARCELCGRVIDDPYDELCYQCDTIIAECVDNAIQWLSEDLHVSDWKARQIIRDRCSE